EPGTLHVEADPDEILFIDSRKVFDLRIAKGFSNRKLFLQHLSRERIALALRTLDRAEANRQTGEAVAMRAKSVTHLAAGLGVAVEKILWIDARRLPGRKPPRRKSSPMRLLVIESEHEDRRFSEAVVAGLWKAFE